MAGRSDYKHNWYIQNRERILANRQNYRLGNLDKIKKTSAIRHKKLKDEKLYQDKRRDVALRKKYGITLTDYETILVEQNGVCGICGRPPKDKRLAVDHDHKTGKVRGLLCYSCNYRLLGPFKDNFGRIKKFYEYCRKHHEN